MNRDEICFVECRGDMATRYLNDLACLRIEVFREFPYLYDGDFKYEEKYLMRYFASPHSFVVVCLHGDKVIGASTAILMSDEVDEIKKPFVQQGQDIERIVYFGESVLLRPYRGLGIGREFFNRRHKFAQSFSQCETTCFCAVRRSPEDHRRPKDYHDLTSFWRSLGYQLNGLSTELSWKEVGEATESPKVLDFWERAL